MRRSRAIAAILLIGTGLVWIGQGTAVLKGSSFMVGDPTWAWIGLACLIAGAAIGVREIRSRQT